MRTVRPPIDPDIPLTYSTLFDLLDWIVDTHLEDAVPGLAGLDIGPTQASYDSRAAQLEGLSRIMWGAAFALNGERKPRSAHRLASGLANGADAKHPSYWGRVTDNDQRAVEMAPIAAVLLENPQLNGRLGKIGYDNICTWMADIQDIDIHPNNWRFFRILVLKALERKGWPIRKQLLAEELDFIDSQYIDGGWYGDNRNAGRDYYNGFAFHYYSLLYARWCRKEDPERAARFIDRARKFALAYRYWFDDDGGHIAYGRSLTYRFATAGFWPLLSEFGHPSMSMGEMKGLWSRSLAWWLRRPIFDPLGRLSIGYAYPNLLMSEFYNSPQSPLWAMKAFFPLALPEDHPFWMADPLPCAYPDDVFVDIPGRFIMQRRDGGAYAIAGAPIQHEMRNCIDKYGKFAYSSRHGFSVEGWRWLERGHLGDNILIFSADGKEWFGRTAILEFSVDGDEMRTVWSVLPGACVVTRQKFTADGERRTHTVDSDKPLQFRATGHAVDAWTRGGIAFNLPASGDAPAALGATLYSNIADVGGLFKRGAVASAPNTNLMFPHSTVPAIGGETGAGRTVIDTVLTYGKRE